MTHSLNQQYILVNPTTEPLVAPFDGADRLATLAGTRLGLIDDSKRNADVLLEELAVYDLRQLSHVTGKGTAIQEQPGHQAGQQSQIGFPDESGLFVFRRATAAGLVDTPKAEPHRNFWNLFDVLEKG